MKEPERSERSPWADAVLAARLFAVDPHGLGGVSLRALPGLARERWLAFLRESMGEERPVRRLPLHVTDSRLLGGLDLAATLRAGRPVAERGILAETDRGVLLVAMAERVSPGTAARIAAVLDRGAVAVERDGLALDSPARIGIVALDEGIAADERPPAALLDRLAFWLDLTGATPHSVGADTGADAIAAARERLPAVTAREDIVESLSRAAMALGVASLRAPLLAVKAARAHAALAGRTETAEEDAVAAARLVLAPRATVLPIPETPPEDQPNDEPDRTPQDQADDQGAGETDRPLADMVLDAARAVIPAGLLEELRLFGRVRPRGGQGGRAGLLQKSKLRGRPIGTRRGDPRTGARLNVVETLRVAAPWQPLRRRERAAQALLAISSERAARAGEKGATADLRLHAGLPPQARENAGPGARVEVRRDDFRITRFKQRTETTTIFAVDASGSAALHRLAEAKGAVELMLAECYVRRDQVALIAFRGRTAELLLPPTRSLVRAKRNLAGLPGGGGTPLAIAIDLSLALADQVRRRGQTAIVIFLTDGQANIGRDGSSGRAKAEEDALAAARALRAEGFTSLLLDTAPHPKPFARKLADEMGATYLPLPYADAAAISGAVRAVSTRQD